MGFAPVRPAIAGGSPGALLRRLLAALLVVLANVLPLFGREAFQPLVVTAFLHRGGHAGQQVLRLRQEVVVEDLGDFIEAMPLHVVRPAHRGAQTGAAPLVVPQLEVRPLDGRVKRRG